MGRAIVTALLASLLALALAAGPAVAAGGQVDEALDEVQLARDGVRQAVEAAEAGDRERGYDLARTAYLDHFEKVEIPLRLRDASLVLDLEFQFAELRDGIRDGRSLDRVRDTARDVRAGLVDVERKLSDEGLAAPAVAFAFSFTILFREGVEAVLILALLLGSLEAGRASDFRRPLGLGALAAVAATGVTWLLATVVVDIAPLERELLEAVTALLAVGVLVLVSFWLVSRLEQRHWVEFMRARVSGAIAAGSALAFAGLGFTAVYREGFETVLFYQALTLFAEGLVLWVVLGAVAGAIALAAVGHAVIRLGRRVPLKPLLVTGASILLLLSVAFAGNAVRSLQEGDWIGVTPIAGDWARLPVFLAELTGIHPTREGLVTQATLIAIYALGALWVFAWRPVRRRQAVRATA
ncbi:MAG TPA: FTR1 family protein [Thermoleophilaceae bacterium]